MSKKRNRSSRPVPTRPAAGATPPAQARARSEPSSAEEAKAKARQATPLPEPRGKPGKRATPLPDARDARDAREKAPRRPPAPAPVFWFGFEIPWAKLVLARVVLFGLLAIDAFLQIRHAPRYGAGDFNVAHLPFLSSVGPGRASYEIGQLLEAYLLALAALGVGLRLVLPIAAALYAWLYFGSQLDSYQHHYLVALVIAIACFVPWQRPPDAAPATPVRSWALRLILVQLGIMYLWAAISKMDPAWASGRTLGGQLTGSLRSVVDATVGMRVASILVIGTELLLACTIWLRPAWRLAAPLGILFHLGIVASGLEIGLFAYLMIGLYLLVIPDALVVRLAETRAARAIRRPLRRLTATTSWAAWAIAIGAGVGIGALVRLEHTLGAAIAASAIPLGLAIRARKAGGGPPLALGAAHLAALALWLACDRASTVAVDYYKFWAGSQRRIGDVKSAEHAYRRLVEVAPDLELGHYYLGRILTSDGRGDEGAPHLREAQRRAPGSARAYMEEARWLESQGKHADAVDKARQGAAAEPGNREARALFDSLSANKAAPSRAAEDDAEKP